MPQAAAEVFDELGPIEYLIVEFPSGQIPDSAFHPLLELADRDVVRILDIEFVARDASGEVTLCDPAEVLTAAGGELASFVGASSGLLDPDDVARVGSLITPGSLAGIVVYESVWVAAMTARLPSESIRVISAGLVPADDLDDALRSSGG